ncbi:MAG: dienelactone hydrolase family protein [Desulfovibrionaceae bacterium]|jgi:dienelactone hydrolase|nr:dienelactone hydrolase family protein [Desulfovibrionaceae bacterium]
MLATRFLRPVLAAFTSLLAALSCAHAAPVAQPLEWQVEGQSFHGYLVYDDASQQPRPGLVMAPDWMGVTRAAIDRAKALAGSRYVILVADYYGKGAQPKDSAEAGQLAKQLRGGDRAALRARIQAAVAALRGQAGRAPVDAGKIGAFGFCLGGTTVLELARAGDKLAGIVTLHGDLSAGRRAAPGSAQTPLLILNGADDKSVTAQHIADFQQEMNAAGADWQLVDFSGAVHCFALPNVGADPASNCRYDERTARRAYRMMDGFFDEVFGR